MVQGKSVPRVSGGVPWWLWVFAILATAVVVVGVIASLDARSADNVFDEAVAALELGQRDAFTSKLEEIRTLDPDPDRLAVLEGINSSATVRYPRAVKQLEPYLDHDDRELSQLALKYSASAYQRMGKLPAARDLLVKMVEGNPDELQPKLLLLRLYSAAGVPDLLVATANDVLEQDPGNHEGLTALTRVQGDLGEVEAAIETCQRLLEKEEDRVIVSPILINRYIEWLLETDQSDVASQFLEDNLPLVSDRTLRFRVYIKTRQLDTAEELLTSLNQPPDSPLSVWLKAVQAIEENDWEKAVQHMERVASVFARQILLFEDFELAATNNQQPDVAAACRANQDAIRELRKQAADAVRSIGDDVSTTQLRLTAAGLSQQLARKDCFDRWNSAALVVAEHSEHPGLLNPRPIFFRPSQTLVPIPGVIGVAPSQLRTADSLGASDAQQEADSEPDPSDSAPTESPETASEESAEEPSEEPAPEPTEEPADSDSQPEESSESETAESDEAPTESPASEESSSDEPAEEAGDGSEEPGDE